MPDPIDDETSSRLRRADWDYLVPALKDYARNKTRRLFWMRQDYEQLARGETAESLVFLAVEKIFKGERKWDWEKRPDLEAFLRSVLDSLISNLVTSMENRKLIRLPVDPERLEAIVRDGSSLPLGQYSVDPETALIEREQMERAGEIVERIRELIRDDPDLVRIFDCISRGRSKAQDIATDTGLSIEDVYQLKRKLKRRLGELRP